MVPVDEPLAGLQRQRRHRPDMRAVPLADHHRLRDRTDRHGCGRHQLRDAGADMTNEFRETSPKPHNKFSPEQRVEIEQIIAAKLDILSAFRDLDVSTREMLAREIEPFFYSRQEALRRPENTYTPRWTNDGADINTDESGVGKGHANPTLPRWIDGHSVVMWLDSDDPQILHFRPGGGGADCMFDHMCSPCWATEIAAGRGTEGQTFTSASGCTFQMWSTGQNAWDTALH